MWLFGKKKQRSDEELVLEYFNSGNKSVLGDLFEKHVKTVYGVCLYYFRDRDTAQDVVMQIFEKLVVELRRTEPRNFKGWLSFVVRNHCLNELKKSKSKRFVPEHYLDFEVREANLDEEEKIASVQEERLLGFLQECLPLLKETQRKCLELFYLKEQSYEQVAASSGYTINEVKSYIQNGKRNLKLLIEAKNRNHAA
jgi:RNA polymerase sigma-70 factor (ECF subfamily)